METIPSNELTNFEKVELISRRSMELQRGANPLIEIGDITNPIEIASIELDLGLIPYIIERKYPNGIIKKFKIGKKTPID
jgi:DNA-directed RNA polymerase subunit K/omega